MDPPPLERSYRLLTATAGAVRWLDRTLVLIEGKDRQTFLQNFCTADIKSLSVGGVTEAFILNGKGKTLWHDWVCSLENQLLLVSPGAYAEVLLSHLEKYIIREDVQLSDCSSDFMSLLVRGTEAAERLSGLLSSLPAPNGVQSCAVDQGMLQVANVEIAGWGFLVLAESDPIFDIQQSLGAVGIEMACESALEVVRIEHSIPWMGRDIDDTHLPQELRRDAQAISFNKGCYLGQETVARIDAMGHVNQLLVRLTIDAAEMPEVGTAFTDPDTAKNIGYLTSVAPFFEPTEDFLSPRRFAGLGFVKRAYANPGTELGLAGGNAVVCGESR